MTPSNVVEATNRDAERPLACGAMTKVYRVTVRGRFASLTEPQRSWLKTHQAEHDLFLSNFSEDGSLTYEPALDFFSFRREVRFETGGDDAEALVAATRSAEDFLKVLRIAHTPLRAAVMDMTAMAQRHRSE